MKKTTIILAIVCSIFVGASMAVTFRMLAGSSPGGAKAGAAGSHNMPPGMSHEEHLKLMAAQNAGQPPEGDSSSASAGVDHNMPPGMSHEEHQKKMTEAAAKQQSNNQSASTGAQSMDHSSMPAGMKHDMPPGMNHEEHMKMME